MFLVNFNLMFHHKYSLTEIEGMVPWERDAYVKIITEYIEVENQRIAAENQRRQQGGK
jgi:hypothetical protein